MAAEARMSLSRSLWFVVPALGAGAATMAVGWPLMRPVAPPAPVAAVDPQPTGSLTPAPPSEAFGDVPAPAAPAVIDAAPRWDAQEIAHFVTVANFYRKGDFAGGDAAAAALTDPLEHTALDWIALRVAANPGRLDAFEKAHPDWPAGDWFQTLRESWLFSGKPSPAETLAVFANKPPISAAGRLALARAELGVGRRDEAERMVRALWRDDDLDPPVETALLREFGAALSRDDHLARASRLLYAERGAAGWHVAAMAGPDATALANARLEAARGPLSARTSAAVPPALRADPGYLFAHVQDARRSGRLDEAEAWLKLAPHDADKLVDPDKWWSERRMVARALLDKGQYERAYSVCAEALARSSPARVDAAFHAGWIALRFLNQPTLASQHFAHAVRAAETPISIARAYYWRGRAAEALGAGADAQTFYGKAAAYPVTYYGQLAAKKLGDAELALRRPPALPIGEARAEATRAIELYLAAGLDDFVSPIAFAAARTWTDEAQLGALAEVLQAKASAATNVIFGKLALERGFPLDATAFPTFGLPDYAPLSGSAGLGSVMAVARQESEFIVRAASGAGAKGLMQILPSTAADTARKAGVAFDYARLIGDPAYNMQLGAAYLGQLMAAEGGSLEMAAAAYNAGAGRVAQWIAAYGDPRAGADMVDWVERIPFDETRDYVMRVAENNGVYQARLAEKPGATLARR
jgi:soluble lytic murein transglycosylase